jgi:methyltransferase (TIGR00027 family)
MTITAEESRQGSGLLSRTSIMVAAARAFGSREPDESVRNPDAIADQLIGPEELDLIRDHPICNAFEQDYSDAIADPSIAGIAWLMLLRTRFIDDALQRAVTHGLTQIVILGAGFDTRAYRFAELLKDCRVVEMDAGPTQAYKRRRIDAVVDALPSNLVYAAVDFTKDDLGYALRAAGIREEEKTFYIWEGVSMYLSESNVRKTLEILRENSAPGSSIVLDYVNGPGVYMGKTDSRDAGGIPSAWGEPWIFGVPGSDGREFFRELGFDPRELVATMDFERNFDLIRRYTSNQAGVVYGARAFEKMKIEAQKRAEERKQEDSSNAEKTKATDGGMYWLAELTVPDRPSDQTK